ncbi:MAG: PAS domain-containing protein [Bacteroidales bacterium]|nr:PAS domain-containing protein [Bacteroidales bacterium]
MSEFINNISLRRDKLYDFSVGIFNGGKRKEFIEKYQDVLDNLTPADVYNIVHRLVEEDFSVYQVKQQVGKILNIFFEPLKNYPKRNPEKNTFLYYLEEENRELKIRLQKIKDLLKFVNKEKNISKENQEKLLSLFRNIKEFEKHYFKKENILFPYLEKSNDNNSCLKVMWAFHDDYRNDLKAIMLLLEKNKPELDDLNEVTGHFFFAVVPVIFREEYILHPVALDVLGKNDFDQMSAESFEIGFAFIKTPPEPDFSKNIKQQKKYSSLGNLFVNLETGELLPEQIVLLLNNLPVDITFVDENDTVKFFSNPKHRFFMRSKAIIGRTVQNCHPHESVHIVEEILQSFKNKEKDKARFWIQMKNSFILIDYYALYDKKGNYKGTIEVSQDITEIRKLSGEQRLLDWNKS